MSDLMSRLKGSRMSAQLAERIARLNPCPKEGERLRGWHYTRFSDPRLLCDVVSKGNVIRQHGRAVFEAIPRQHHVKRGRRVYLPREAVEDARQ